MERAYQVAKYIHPLFDIVYPSLDYTGSGAYWEFPW